MSIGANDKVRVGIIGCGGIANGKHLIGLKTVPEVDMVAFCDIIKERAEAACKKYGTPDAKVYTDYKELLCDKSIDVVHVCTPNRSHSFITVDALEAGKHVMCEKPMAINSEEAKKMLDAAKRTGKKLTIGYQNRQRNDALYLKDAADHGEFGDIYYAKTSYLRRRGTPTGWFTDKRVAGGGPILDIAVHRIDAAWYMMGNPKPVRVSAAVSNRLGAFRTKGIERWQGTPCPDNQNDTEDFGAGAIHFENGAILLFEASWAINGPDFQYTQLYGTKGGVTLDPLTVYGERNGYLSDDKLNPGPGKSFELEIAHFVDCVLTGAPTRTPVDQACDLQRMLQGIYDSARLGREVTL